MCRFLSRGEREGKSCERDRDAHICATSQSSVLPSTAREHGELLRVYIGGSTTKRSQGEERRKEQLTVAPAAQNLMR